MGFLIGGLLALFVVAAVLYPFFPGRVRTRTSSGLGVGRVRIGRPATAGRRPNEHVYDDINTLRLEYELGQIEEEEYHQRLREYRLEAEASLKEQDGLEQRLDQSLEEEILAARAHRAANGGIDQAVEGETDGTPSSGGA